MPRMQSLYFIRSGKEGPVKIGIAIDPLKRLEECQIGNSEKLLLIGSKEIEGNAKIVEDEIKRMFGHLHIRGEWFKPDQEMSDFIDNIDRFHRHTDKLEDLPAYPCAKCGKEVPYPFEIDGLLLCGECFVHHFNKSGIDSGGHQAPKSEIVRGTYFVDGIFRS